MITDNSLRIVSSLDDITHIRTTQIKNFLECPARWKADILGEGKNNTSKAAETGTLIHRIIEDYLLCKFELFTTEWDAIQLELEATKVPAKERTALLHLLQSLTEQRQHLLYVETETTLKLLSDFFPITSHIDSIFSRPEGGVVIRDWKTNRQYQGLDYWQNQIQPLLYSLAVSTFINPDGPIFFEIVYVNLETTVTWEVTKEHIDRYRDYLTQQYSFMRDEFNVYKRTGEWPERINEHCGFCCRRDNCQTLKNSHNEFLSSLMNTDEEGLAQRFLHTRNVYNAVDKQLAELKERLIEEVQNSNGLLEDAGHIFKTRRNKKREVSFIPLWNKLHEVVDPSDIGLLMEWLDKATTVKVTEVDALLAEYPDFTEDITPLIETKEFDTYNLTISPQKKL